MVLFISLITIFTGFKIFSLPRNDIKTNITVSNLLFWRMLSADPQLDRVCRTPVSVVREITAVRSLVFRAPCHHVILQLQRDNLHGLEVLQGKTEGSRGQQQPRDSA